MFYDLEKACAKTGYVDSTEPFQLPGLLCRSHSSATRPYTLLISHGNNLSEKFLIINGLKQRCVFASTLLSLYLTAMLYEIPPENAGVEIK